MHIGILAPIAPFKLMKYMTPGDAANAATTGGDAYGTATTALVGALLDAGHRVTAVSHRRGYDCAVYTGDRLSIIQVRSRSSARAQALDHWKLERDAMVDAIARARPDVVHAHWTYEWALAALSLDSAVPVAITVRDAPLTVLRHHRDSYRLLRLLLAIRVRAKASRATLIANSPYMAHRWKAEMLDSRVPMVIPNMTPMSDNRLLSRSQNPTVVEVADSGDRKNVKTLLRAFSEVNASIPKATLIIIGSGLGPNSEIAEWARQQGLAQSVQFLGVLEHQQTMDHLASAWLHAHASLEESFGNTLVEAMELGVAVLGGASSGAVPWVLDFGRAGELTDVQEVDAFSKSMIDLLSNIERTSRLAASGQLHVRRMFSPESVAGAHISLYRKLASTERGNRK